MKYAIELNFDKSTTERVKNLWNIMVENNLAKAQTNNRPYVPHISLAVTPDLDEEKYIRIVEEYASKNPPLDVLMVSLGLFRDETNVLFLAPQTNDELLKTNKFFDLQFRSDNVENWHYYHPERWVAHCAITANSSFEEIVKAFSLCVNFSLPFKAKADKIALVDFKQGREICIANFKS
jgi:2'-5' RNA ligase